MKTVSRRVERLANLCWNTLVARDLVLKYIGTPLYDIRAPRDIIFYLAFYVHLDVPFFQAIQQQPFLLFSLQSGGRSGKQAVAMRYLPSLKSPTVLPISQPIPWHWPGIRLYPFLIYGLLVCS